MNYFDGVHVFGTCSSIGPLDYKELFVHLAFSTTPSSDRYAMHVSVDMIACPWKLNYGDHHVSYTSARDSHDTAPTHDTTPPRRAPHPSRPLVSTTQLVLVDSCWASKRRVL